MNIDNENNNNNNNNEPKNIIKLKQSETLKQNGLVTDSIYYIDTNTVKISLNHAVNTDIIFTIDKKKWHKNLDTIVEQAEEYGIYDKELSRLLKYHLNDNYDEIIGAFSKTNTITTANTNDYDDSDGNDDKPKREITTFKYSQLGQGHLYESVFIENGKPVFIKYNDQLIEFEKVEQIEEATRILTPPSYEECPYLRYEFDSLDEINSINKLIDDNHIDLDYLYKKGYKIVSKYNNQSVHKLRLATIKIITSHFQDRFPTTEYDYLVGGNGSGKSSLAETFRAIAYKTVVMTDPSAPNLFRLLGIVEPV